jgi:hypothetical protein
VRLASNTADFVLHAVHEPRLIRNVIEVFEYANISHVICTRLPCWSEEALTLNDDPDTSSFERIPSDHFNRMISMWKLVELLALRLRELRRGGVLTSFTEEL